MGTAVEEPTTSIEPPEAAEAERPREDIFEYSRWLNVGPGAAECEHVLDGKCTNAQHFHAWIRLPNPFQIRDIAEKAKAAQARRRRMLRDPETDAYVILEAGLDELRDEAMKPMMVEHLLGETFAESYHDAISEVMERDDPDAEPDEETGEVPKRYALIEQDREELTRLAALDEDERDKDAFEALDKHLAAFNKDVDEEIERLQKPRREGLEEKTLDELVDLMRTRRINEQAEDEYLSVFNAWQWYVCTYKPREKGVPRERYFSDISELKFHAPSIVVETLRENFRDLEIKLARNKSMGNS